MLPTWLTGFLRGVKRWLGLDASAPAMEASPAERAYRQTLAVTEESLVQNLLGSQARHCANLPPLLPEGFAYLPRETGKSVDLGKTLFLSPHPSDVSADFYPVLIRQIRALGGECRQIILTRGEHGDDSRTPHETIAVRHREEQRSAALTGLNVDYLTRHGQASSLYDDAQYFPDGQLLQHLPELIDRLKQTIQHEHPTRLGLPALYPDHPDHLATAVAAIHALLQLREEGYFLHHGPIEVFTSDPEFGIAAGQPWAVQQMLDLCSSITHHHGDGASLPPLADLLLHAVSGIPALEYRYRTDPKTRAILPASDITNRHDAHAFTFAGPVAVPPLIIAASAEDEQAKLKALFEHKTQMEGKSYANLIPQVDRLRALQIQESQQHHGALAGQPAPEWATALYPVEIPGITTGASSLIDALPQGHVFQLHAITPERAGQLAVA
jgi:LmbE family N-acetylglucosaminyl deacetylase